jgi:hypothetical protein
MFYYTLNVQLRPVFLGRTLTGRVPPLVTNSSPGPQRTILDVICIT